MTKEEKQLLLKDICARLPYGVMINFSKDEDLKNLKIKSAKLLDILCENIENVYVNTESVAYLNIEYVRPYLCPISSMMEEDENEYRAINCYEGLFPHNEDALDYALKHHLDYCSLIPMGLALEAPKDMYKTE